MRMRMVVSETAPRVFLLVNISRRSKKAQEKKGDKRGKHWVGQRRNTN